MALIQFYVVYTRHEVNPNCYEDPMDLVADFPEITIIETEYQNGNDLLAYIEFDDSIVDELKQLDFNNKALKYFFDAKNQRQAVQALDGWYEKKRFSDDADGITIWDKYSWGGDGDSDLVLGDRKVVDIGSN
jgi:hypothetical protein